MFRECRVPLAAESLRDGMRMREGKYARTSSRVNNREVQFLYRRRSVSYYGALRFFFSDETSTARRFAGRMKLGQTQLGLRDRSMVMILIARDAEAVHELKLPVVGIRGEFDLVCDSPARRDARHVV